MPRPDNDFRQQLFRIQINFADSRWLQSNHCMKISERENGKLFRQGTFRYSFTLLELSCAIRRQTGKWNPCFYKWLSNKTLSPIQQAFKEPLSDPRYYCFSTWFSQRGKNNRKWMKITDDT